MGADFTRLGYLQIGFSVIAESSIGKTAPAGTYMVRGRAVEISEAVLSPTGLCIRFGISENEFPWDLDCDIYADGQRLTDSSTENRASYLDYLMGHSLSDILEGLIRAPLACNDIEVISLVPIERSTGAPLGRRQLNCTSNKRTAYQESVQKASDRKTAKKAVRHLFAASLCPGPSQVFPESAAAARHVTCTQHPAQQELHVRSAQPRKDLQSKKRGRPCRGLGAE